MEYLIHMTPTLEKDLQKSRPTILTIIIAVFLAIVSFLTFAYFAFTDTVPTSPSAKTVPQSVQINAAKKPVVFNSYTDPTYKFSLTFPSSLQTKITTKKSQALKKQTFIGFGEYSGKSMTGTDPQFTPYMSLTITEGVASSTTFEELAKLDSTMAPVWENITVGGLTGKKVQHTNCLSKKCVNIYIRKGTTIYTFENFYPTYRTQFHTIVENFSFTNS